MITPAQSAILRKEFDPDTICVKVQALSKDRKRAMLVLYAQHTDIADRIEEVDPNWSFDVLDDRTSGARVFVRARLTILGVSRGNYGEGDDYKGACSDALKRCAMLFGVGRYLYDSEGAWVPYNLEADRFRVWTYSDWAPKKSKIPSFHKPPQEPPKSPIRPLSVVKPVVKSGVYPEQPPADVGVQETGVVIPYGPLAKQFVHKADPVKLREYVLEIEGRAKRRNKPIPLWAQPVIRAAEPIIASFENRQFEDRRVEDCCG